MTGARARLNRKTTEMTNQIEAASRALHEASRSTRSALPLNAALFGCPDCRGVRMITCVAPLGSCPDCWAERVVLSPSSVTATARPALAA